MANDKLKNMLINHKIRPSIQRLMIFEYMEGNKEHPNVEKIFNALVDKIPTLSRTTVYNTMELFEKHGLVQALNIEENETRYDAYVEPHIHFKCIKCGNIYDIDYDCEIMRLENIDGDKILTKKFYFTGICMKCLNKK